MSQQAIIQKAMKRNAKDITLLHADLTHYKHFKATADASGDLEVEYFYHSMVKYVRQQIKDYVAEQKFLKQLNKRK